jgi:hypothetical protein
MAFTLLSKPRSKTQGIVKPGPTQKPARVQGAADLRFGFTTPTFQPPAVALPMASVIQTKLKIGEANDRFEQEADRIADQVTATPAQLAFSAAPPLLQRVTGQPTGEMDAAPASVGRAVATPGRPLEPALRQEMEQRLGYDFSRVRVHAGGAAEQSAQDVNARAYTVGQDIVFGADRLRPATHEGRWLIAHELTHVVQQSSADGISFGQSHEKRGLSPVARVGVAIQRDKLKHEAKPPAPWTVDELKQMLRICDGGLDIWAKAKKANNGKDPEIVRESGLPFIGLTERTLGRIKLESKLDKCGAAQVLIFELTNLSHKTDFDQVDCAALAGELSRDQYIWKCEMIERTASMVNEIQTFDKCKDKWRCEPNQRVSDPRVLYLDEDEYHAYLAANAASHLEHYGQWWDTHYKGAYTALYFTSPVTGKPSPPTQEPLYTWPKNCSNKPGGESVNREQSRWERVTEETLGAWVRIRTREGVQAEVLEQRLLGSHEISGSQAAKQYWADFLRQHFDELKAGKSAGQVP